MNQHIKYLHYRAPDPQRGHFNLEEGGALVPDASPKAGATVAYTVADGGAVLNFAIAWCSSKDNFSRKRGRELATSRLQSGHGLPIGTPTISDFRTLMDVLMEKQRGYSRR